MNSPGKSFVNSESEFDQLYSRSATHPLLRPLGKLGASSARNTFWHASGLNVELGVFLARNTWHAGGLVVAGEGYPSAKDASGIQMAVMEDLLALQTSLRLGIPDARPRMLSLGHT